MNPTCNKVKIIHVITRFDRGGSAENTFLTVRDLDKDRYDVVLVTGSSHPANSPDRSGEPETAAIEANIASLREEGVRMISIPHLVREPNPLADVAAFFSLARIFRRERPRIVHTHTSKAGIIGRLAAFICRVPIIIHTPHGHVFWGYFNPWQTRLFILLERWTARITTRIVALTPQERADHLHFRIAPEEKFTVIHSGVDLGLFFAPHLAGAKVRTGLGISPDTTVIATAGRLTAVKGQATLIRAVAELLRQREKVFLLILGEGELRSDLEALSTDLGVAEAVRFLGWRSDVAAVMAACDIFCLPSLNEGMGKVLVEAMALGKPIIASAVGGIRDLVRTGENGLLVPPGDSAALAEAIIRLINDPAQRQRLGEAGGRLAPHYSSEEMIHAIDRLYGRLLETNLPTRDSRNLL